MLKKFFIFNADSFLPSEVLWISLTHLSHWGIALYQGCHVTVNEVSPKHSQKILSTSFLGEGTLNRARAKLSNSLRKCLAILGFSLLPSLTFASSFNVTTTAGDTSAGSLGGAIAAATLARAGISDTVIFSALFNSPQTITLTGSSYPSVMKIAPHTFSIAPSALLEVIGPGLSIFNFSGGGTFNINNISVNGDISLGVNTTLAGALTISANGANLLFSAGSTSTNSFPLMGLLNIITNDNVTMSGRITGPGSLSVAGAGILTLSNNLNNYSGGTAIGNGINGILSIDASGQLGTGALTFDAGTLITSQAGALNLTPAITLAGAATINVSNAAATTTLSGNMSGAGGLTVNGLGTLVLSGNNSYTGGTMVSAGTLQGTPASIQGAIVNNSAVVFTAAGTYAGNMTGSGSLTKNNTGTLILSGTNSYTGGTTVNAGTLQGTTSSLQGAIINNANVTFSQAGAGTYAGNMSGTGSLTISGGTITLTGTNTYSGGTNLAGGILKVSSDNPLGSSGLTFTGGTLQTTASLTSARAITLGAGGGMFNVASGTTANFSGGLTGLGSLTASGLGTLALTGATLPTGNMLINAGTTLNLSPSAALSYAGSMTGLGTLVVGNNNLTFTGSTYTLPTIVGTGNTLQLAPTAGTLTYSGAISGNGSVALSGGNRIVLTAANTYTGGTTVSGGTTLSLSNSNQLGSGPITLDNGILQLTADVVQAINIAAGGGILDVPVGQELTLWGALTGSGTLTKTGLGTLVIGGVSLSTGNIVISQGILNLRPSSPVTYAGAISGNGALMVSDNTVTLTGDNTSAGPTTVAGGVLEVSDDAQLGSTSPLASVALSGGTLRTTASINSNRPISLSVEGKIDVSAGATTTFTGLMTETQPSELSVSGLGTFVPANSNNAYSNGTNINAGVTVQISDSGNLGTGPVIFTGGTLEATGTFNLNQDIALGTVGGVFQVNSGNTLGLSGIVTGSTPFIKSGPGDLDLRGSTNQATGDMIFNDGVVLIDAANQLTSGNVTFNAANLVAEHAAGTLSLPQVLNLTGDGTVTAHNASANIALTGSVIGAGAFTLMGPGSFDLTGLTNTATGAFAINNATVRINQADQLGSGNLLSLAQGYLQTTQLAADPMTLTQAISLDAGGGILEVSTPGALTTLSGPLSGEALVVSGPGTVALSHTGNSHSGTTIDTGSTLSITSAGNLGSPTGFLNVRGGTLTINGIILRGPRRASPSLSLNQAIDLNGGGLFNVDASQVVSLNGPISGTGPLAITGGGTVALTNSSNTYTNGTEVSQGSTLSVSADAQLGDSGGSVTLDGATLQTTAMVTSARSFNLSGLGGIINVVSSGSTTTLSNGITSITPGAALMKLGSGSLVLGGNSLVDSTTVSQGKFLLSGSLTSGLVTVDGGAFFGGTGSITGHVINNGTIAPQGNLDINGDLTTTPTSTYLCNVGANGASDQITVTGNAQLDGNIQVVAAPGTYAVGQIYTILTAASLNGTFTNVFAPTGYGFQTGYENNAVKLLLTAVPSGPTPPPPGPSPTPTPTPRDVVQVLSGSNTGNVVSTIVSYQTASTDTTKARPHYDDGFHFNAMDFAPSRGSLPQRHISDRTQVYGETLQSIFHILAKSGPINLERQENRLWVSPYYSYSHNDLDATTKATSRDEGVLIGFDWRSASSILGVIVGGGKGTQTSPSTTSQNNTVDSKSVILGVYHSLMFLTDGRYDLIINGSANRRRSKRFGNESGVDFRADGNLNSYDITGDLSTSWAFRLPEQFSIRPSIGITTGYSHQDPFTESNAGVFNQRYASQKSYFFEPYVGVGVRREWKNDAYVMKLTGVIEQGYKVVKGNSATRFFSATGPVEGTTITSLRAGPNTTHLTTYGSILDLDTNLKYILGYTATLQKHATVHTFTIKCEYRF